MPNFLQLEQENGLPQGFLNIVMLAESNGNTRAVSPAGAKGAFQFMPATAKQYNVSDPFDLKQSANGAAQMYGDLMRKYDGNISKSLAAYNWGQGNLDRKGLSKAPKETRDYIKKIQKNLIKNAGQESVQKQDNNSEYERALQILSEKRNVQNMITPVADMEQSSQNPQDFEYQRALQLLQQKKAGNEQVIEQPQANQDASLIDKMGRGAGLATRSVTKGIAGLPLMVGDAANSLVNLGVRGVNSLTGAEIPYLRSASESFDQLQNMAGLPQPETGAERVASTVGEFVGGTGSTIAGGLSLAKNAIRPTAKTVGETLSAQPIAQSVGAVTGGLASGEAKEAGYSPAAQFGAGLVGGALPMVASGTVSSLGRSAEPLTAEQLAPVTKKAAEGGFGSTSATKILAEQANPDPKIVQAAKNLGVQEYLQPDQVTTNQAYRELAQAVKSMPASTARDVELKSFDAVGKRADDLIAELGGTNDISRLDKSIKSRMVGIQEELDNQSEKLYGELRKAIPAKAEAPASNVLKWINEQADELGGVEYLSPLEKSVLSKLSPKDGKQPTYALLDRVRKDLTASRVKNKGEFKDADTGLIKKLESQLMKDQQAVVGGYGVSELFDTARKTVAVRKGVEDDIVSLFGKGFNLGFGKSIQGDLSTAVKALPKGDVTKLQRIIRLIPEDMRQETVASGLNTAFGNEARAGTLNFKSYQKWYEGLLKNKEAYRLVMSNLPQGSRKQLSDLYRVSRGINLASRERITTGRLGVVADKIEGADGLIANIYDKAKRGVATAAAEKVTSSLGYPGVGLTASIVSSLIQRGKNNAMKAADQLISSPEFLNLVNKQADQRAIKIFTNSAPFKRYMNSLPKGKKLTNSEQWVLKAIQSGIQTRNKQETNQ